ncbi:MAG TPA: tetratricopeptide repeat protein, partial [Pseudomonadota bacterium]|nr:tetratricopeptide repeat protein [Pseudomonadota bacterium]
EVAEMPGALPLLSFTLSELFRAYLRSGREDRSLHGEDYAALGGVGGALSQRAEAIYAALDTAHAETLRRLMLRMVSLQAGEVARRRVPLSELDYGRGHAEQGRIETLLNQLQEARLIVAGRDAQGTPYVEPAHDKLVLGWPRLWGFLQNEQELIPLQRLLTQEAALWEQRGRGDEHLWAENPRLALAWSQLTDQPLRWNACETAFIQKSEARRVQRLDDAVDIAEQIVKLAETGLKRIAGATQIRAELMGLCQRLLESLGPSSQGHRGAQRTEAWTLIQQADLLWASNEPDHLAQARALYEQAMALDERQLQECPDDPKARLDLTGTLHKVATVATQMGQLTQARAYLDRALQLSESVAANPASLAPELTVHSQRQLGITLDRLAALSTRTGALAEARTFATRGMGICEQLAANHPEDGLAQHDLLIAIRRLGEVIEEQSEFPQARAMYQRSLALARRTHAASPNDVELKREISISLALLSDVAEKMGQLSEAMGYCEQAQKISEELAAADPSDGQALRNRAIGLKKLGQLAAQMGNLGTAQAHIELALEISEAQAAADPADAQAQRDLAIGLSLLGDIELQLDQAAQAQPRYQRALQIAEVLFSANPTDVQAKRDLALLWSKLGQVARQLDNLAEAEDFFRRELSLNEALAAADPADARAQRELSLSLNALGDAAGDQEQLSRANALYRRSLQISETLAAADPSNALVQHDLTSTLQRLASITAAEGRDDEAEDLFRRALAILEDLARMESDSPERQHEFLATQIELADFLQERGQRPAAQKIARAAAALLGRVRHQLTETQAVELDEALHRLLPHGEGSRRNRR